MEIVRKRHQNKVGTSERFYSVLFSLVLSYYHQIIVYLVKYVIYDFLTNITIFCK